MGAKETVRGFGLMIVGSEVLDGRVTDRHFVNARDLLGARRLELCYSQVLPDEPGMMEDQLQWAMARNGPFFCCGGIGSTPDDRTRGCAARVAGVPLEHHPEGVEILKRRWGKDATAARLRMVEFPKGAVLIPNPVNQVPGFRIGNGHFLPGFPEMAKPMMAWVLDTWYTVGEAREARELVLSGVREADLVDLMERFIARHPDVAFSSLPRFVERGTELHLGLSGPPGAVARGLGDLRSALDEAGVTYRAARRAGPACDTKPSN